MVTVFDRVRKMVAEQLVIVEEKIVPESNFVEDLDADSLDLVELVMTLEREFGTEIPDEEADTLVTVQDAVDYLKQRGLASDES